MTKNEDIEKSAVAKIKEIKETNQYKQQQQKRSERIFQLTVALSTGNNPQCHTKEHAPEIIDMARDIYRSFETKVGFNDA